MVLAKIPLTVVTDSYLKQCYACDKPGCPYRYDFPNGYFTIRGGEHIERDMRYWRGCPKDALPMYIADFEPQGSKRTWRCARISCTGNCVTEGQLQVKTAAR